MTDQERRPRLAKASQIPPGLMIQQAATTVWCTDRELRLTSFSGEAGEESLWPGPVVGMTLPEYFRTDDAEFPPIAAHRRALRGESVSYLFRWAGHTYQASVVPHRDPEGRIIGCIGSARRVTHRNEIEGLVDPVAAAKEVVMRESGIDVLPNLPWGTHLCFFYEGKQDLIEILVPYFEAGLRNNEFCMWVASEPLAAEEAKKSLKGAVKNLDAYIAKGQIEFFDYSSWYTESGTSELDRVFHGWVQKHDQAIKSGFAGLRLTGNTFWLEEADWGQFVEYEATVSDVVRKYRMIGLCAYALDKCTARELVNVASTHQFGLIRQSATWQVIQSAEHKQIQLRNEHLARFSSENPYPVLRIAPHGIVLYANAAAETLLGELSCSVGSAVPADWQQLTTDAFDSASKRQTDVAQMGRIFSFVIVPLNNAGYVNWYGYDVTERRQAEQEREKLLVELEAKNSELERFTYTVSHDLKSPLITIQGFMGQLKQDAATGRLDRMNADIERIRTAAEKMQRLLDELLELSRIGRLVEPSVEVSLKDLAAEAAQMLAGPISQRGVHVEISPHLPVVFGSRLRLAEVLQNLIDNAVKFMGDQRQPRIQIGARQDRDETVYYVRDNGIGIAPRYHEKVFGLFDQLDPDSPGTGVGLALVKRIIEVHGGRIWVESDGLGQGSTFCFVLPRKKEAADHE